MFHYYGFESYKDAQTPFMAVGAHDAPPQQAGGLPVYLVMHHFPPGAHHQGAYFIAAELVCHGKTVYLSLN